MSLKTSISWCDMTANPVWGCLNTCPYCYARKIARRFGKTEDQKSFVPTWMNRNYSKAYPDKPQFVFVNSMSDIAFCKDTWIETVTDQAAMDKFNRILSECYFWPRRNIRKLFFSVEPLLTEIKLTVYPDWLIIGAETGNRKGRVIPRQDWIKDIIEDCDMMDVPVWMKDSLKDICPGDLIQDRPEVGV